MSNGADRPYNQTAAPPAGAVPGGESARAPASDHLSQAAKRSSPMRSLRHWLRTSPWTSWLSECYQILRSAGVYYSQYGEDVLILAYLRHRQQATGESLAGGTYIEIGANRPVAGSNTYKLYRLGWRGLVIDATPRFEQLFRKFRRHDVCEHLAIGLGEGPLRFYSFGVGSPINSADPSHVAHWRSEFKGEPEEVCVPKQTLAQAYARHAGRFPTVDLLSVDVEGMDLEVLQSNDWSLLRPRMVVVEQLELRFDEMHRSPVSEYMRTQGYRFYTWAPYSIIFVRDDQFPFA